MKQPKYNLLMLIAWFVITRTTMNLPIFFRGKHGPTHPDVARIISNSPQLHYLGAFNEPIFVFSSTIMLSSLPISASHCASSAGEGPRFAAGSEPSESKLICSVRVIISLSDLDPASKLSHRTRLKSCKWHYMRVEEWKKNLANLTLINALGDGS